MKPGCRLASSMVVTGLGEGRRDGVNAKSRHSENRFSPVRRRSEKLVAQETSLDTMKRLTLEARGQVAQHHPGRRRSLHGRSRWPSTACYLNNGAGLHCGLAPESCPEDRPRRSEAIGQGGRPKKIKNWEIRGTRASPSAPLASTRQYKARGRSTSSLGSRKVRSSSIGGERSSPGDLKGGNFVKPTVFANVTPRDAVSRRKKSSDRFLSILTYKTEAEAIGGRQ